MNALGRTYDMGMSCYWVRDGLGTSWSWVRVDLGMR